MEKVMSIISLGLVVLTWIGFLCLYIRSRKYALESQYSPLKRVLYQMSVCLLSKLEQRKKNLYLSENKERLKTLYPIYDAKMLSRHFYAQKMSTMLLLFFLGIHIIALFVVLEQRDSVLQGGNRLVRGEFGTEAQTIELDVETQGEKNSISFLLEGQKYSEEEIEKEVSLVSEKLQTEILGENESLNCVTEDLNLPEHYEGCPLSIDWESDNYAIVDSDGTVHNQDMIKSEIVTLTAILSYETQEYECIFPVHVYPPKYTQEENSISNIEKAIDEAQESQSAQKEMMLPQTIDGKEVSYTVHRGPKIVIYMVVLAFILIVVFLGKDQDLKKEVEKRECQLELAYPEFVTQFVLLLGAGMTIRNILLKMSESETMTGYLSQELRLLARDLGNGMLETDAIDQFGKRCGNTFYIKFCALVIQNQKKGTKDLLTMLEGEAKEAFLLRKNQARRLGEEAGTKLLVPMTMMLFIVIVLIMIPAFLSFQL